MSLLEWIAEGRRHHPIGSTDLGPDHHGSRPPAAVKVRGAIAVAMVAGVLFFIATTTQGRGEALKWGFAFAFYLFVGYLIRPKPNYDNVGWFGGLIDNPFRWSDGVNRLLVFLLVLFLPARFVSTSLVELAALRSPDRPAT